MGDKPSDMERRTVIWRDAQRLCEGEDPDSDEVLSVAMLLASAVVGPGVNRIAKLLDVSRARIGWMGRNARRNGIWRGGKVHADWFGEDGGLALVCDSAVVLGLMERNTP